MDLLGEFVGSGQSLCNGQCIDPESDNRYCGATADCMGSNAGEKCASGEVCSGGTCGASCVSGQILCNGQCIDPDTDNRYCGATGDCQGTNDVVCKNNYTYNSITRRCKKTSVPVPDPLPEPEPWIP